jgi:hypothetical protein
MTSARIIQLALVATLALGSGYDTTPEDKPVRNSSVVADAARDTTPALAAPALLGQLAELTAPEQEVVAVSTSLFRDAGLDFSSEIVPSFHDTTEDCGDNLGLSTIENNASRVRVCWSHENEGIEQRLQLQALVHEMAHAWTDQNLDDAIRQAFVVLTGSDTWNRRSSDWQERGTERAADLITWALLDPPVLFVEFDGMSCDVWAAAFEVLTDRPAPISVAGAC